MKENFSFDNLVGLPSSERENYDKIAKFTDDILRSEQVAFIEGFELNKTPRDIFIIQFVSENVDHYLKDHGRQNIPSVPLEKIHVLREGGAVELSRGKSLEASSSSMFSSIIVDRKKSDIEFALRLFHELFHVKSYKTLQLTKSERKQEVKTYRSGFSVVSRDGQRIFFKDFEEAVITLFTQRFLETLKRDPAFSGEQGTDFQISRSHELSKMNELIDDLWNRNKDLYPSRESIVDIFLDAQINGRLLKVGRLIEKTYGRHSFRQFGQDNSGRKD